MPDLPPPSAVDVVVVTAARLPPRISEQAFSTVRLEVDRLRAAARVDEALTAAPGVSLFRRASSLSANPTTQGISLRAIAPSGAGRALVTLDGAPLNDPFGGWVIWSQLPPAFLEGAEITRGAGAGPYGAGALTGVIALRERGEGQMAELGLGERGVASVQGAAMLGIGRARLFIGAGHERGDGYVAVRGGRGGAADTRLDLDSKAFAARLDAPVGPVAFSARIAAYDETRGAGLAGARASADGASVSLALARAPAADQWGWRVQAWRRRSDLANSSVSVAADRASTTPANSQDQTPAVGRGVNVALRRVSGALEWELGADGRVSRGEVRERFRYLFGGFTRGRVAGGEASVVGGYVEGAWRGHTWLATGGLRLDQWAARNGKRVERDLATGAVVLDDRPVDRSGEVVSARLGLRRALGEGAAVRAAAYGGFRAPTLNELHRPFRVGADITEANAALRPERLIGIETGLSRQGARGLIEATVFWNRLEDPVTNVTLGVGPAVFPRAGFVPAGGVLRERRNTGRIEAVGIEASAQRSLTRGLEARAALSATDARVRGGAAPQLTGKRPAQAPGWSATAGLAWRASDRLVVDLDLKREGRRYDDDLNSRRLAASTTINARLSRRLGAGTGLYLALDNLLDADVQTGRTADGVVSLGPPRQMRVGLTVRR